MDKINDAIGQRVVKAAAERFVEDGYAGTSTAAVARSAGTSKRELYERFPTKEALFEHVMHYICTQVAVNDPLGVSGVADRATLEVQLELYGKAVLERFILPDARAVFVAAVAAIPYASNVIKIFWDEGPGQAADAIAKVLSAAKKRGDIEVARPRESARWFILECCGPVVLGQLFDPTMTFSRNKVDSHVKSVVDRFLAKLA